MKHPTTKAMFLFVLALGSRGTLAAQVPPMGGEARPNVLFLAVDDLRPALGCYGDPHAKTPNMDRLAARGMRFDRAYCQVAVCNPSRASLMTGQRPDRLGVWTLPIHFREAQPHAVTLPQWFRLHGYTAVGHGKIYHNPTPDPQSWSDPIHALPDLPYPYPQGTRELIRAGKRALAQGDWRKNNLRGPSTAAPDLPDEQVLDGARTRMALRDLRRLAQADEPFFLAMGFIRPHLAFVAPKRYWDLYDPSTLPKPATVRPNPMTPRYALHNNSELSHYVDMKDVPKPWDEERVSAAKTQQLVHGYYACVSYVDAQIGLLLDALDQEGMTDNTVIVLWSDHGWKLGEYGGWGKMTNYELDTRVPLIISAPGMEHAGAGTSQLAELVDLFPTLCEMTGVPVPNFVDGLSLAPLLTNPEEPIQELASSQYYRKLNGEEFMGYAIRTERYRLVEWREFASGKPTAGELYDCEVDPGETRNLIEEVPEDLLEQLTRQLLGAHPRKPLSLLPAIHSAQDPTSAKAQVIVRNESASVVRVYPISTKGRRGRAKEVACGATLTLNTRLGSVFVLESHDGRLHEVHSPSIPTRAITLK